MTREARLAYTKAAGDKAPAPTAAQLREFIPEGLRAAEDAYLDLVKKATFSDAKEQILVARYGLLKQLMGKTKQELIPNSVGKTLHEMQSNFMMQIAELSFKEN